MSESQSQQERLQVIAEKKKWQMEVENKKRQLEDERRQLQHLKSKALRERWLLDGAPSAGPEEEAPQTQSLEQTILRLEQELEELEMGVSATPTKENLVVIRKEDPGRLGDGLKVTPADSVKVVHEVRGMDSALENGVRLLSSSEVDDLIHKADVADAVAVEETVGVVEKREGAVHKVGVAENVGVVEERITAPPVEAKQTPRKEITGLEAKPTGGEAPTGVGGATVENPVSMVFMGYQDVEDEAETKKVLGLEGTVKAELVCIEDCAAKNDPAPSNGSAPEVKGQEEEAGPEAGQAAEPQAVEAEPNSKEKRPCKCCSIM
ncbi:hypothetical protein SKAU_G00319400 [Synaphobranchus kaupii]|uniref:Paralemmin-1 n=1 Tax=Synaphobranchus kaupii TaxID=118154 RepID=A0A9Q1ENE9_SYNKA|nr:hypothetical protein SKAU_G00319400 [Synaphobranchus kaupii]